jgi:WD40 repeat protein
MNPCKKILIGYFVGFVGFLPFTSAQKPEQPLPKDAIRRIGPTQFRTGAGILNLAYSPDGKWLVAGGRNSPVAVFEAGTGKLVRRLNEPFVWAVAISPDGKTLATGGASKVIRLWDLGAGKEIKVLKGHAATITALAFSAEGSVLASGSDEGTVRTWTVSDGNPIARYTGPELGVTALAIAADGKHVAAAGTDRTIRVWNGKQLDIETPAIVTGLAFGPQAQSFIAASDDGMIRVWNFETAKQLKEWKGHDAPITHMAAAMDDKTIATTGADRTIRVWDVSTGKQICKVDRHANDGDALALSPDGKQVAAGGLNNTVRRWNATTGQALPGAASPDGAVTAVASSSASGLMATGYSTNQVVLYDIGSGAEKGRLHCGPEGAEVLLSFSRDGKTLATASPPSTLIVWDLPAGKEKKRLTLAERDEIRCLACSPDGTKLAAGYTNGGVRIWDAVSGKVTKDIDIPKSVRALAYSRNGAYLAVGVEDMVGIFSTDSGELVRGYPKLNDVVACLAYAPDDRTLAAGMFATGIRLFDLTQPIKKANVEARSLEGHVGVVNAVTWSVNGRMLASGGFDQTVRLWEFVNGKPIVSWSGHDGEVSGVAVDPSSRTVVSGSLDTTLVIWDATRLGRGGKLPDSQKLPTAALDVLWKELASDNNVIGNAALWKMVSAVDSPTVLKQKIFLTDPKKIERYLADLNSKVFKVREQAMVALASYERWIEGVLRKTLENPPSEEARQRVELLLNKLSGTDAISLEQERLRARRAIEALEQIGTPSAGDLLRALAAGAAEEDLRDMAQAAVERLGRRD